MTDKHKTEQTATGIMNAVWAALYLVGLGIFLVFMPKYNDDFWYATPLREWFAAIGCSGLECGMRDVATHGVPFRAIAEVWREHCVTDNARLCNLVVPFFLILPKWVGSLLALGAWAVVMRVSLRLAGVDMRRSPVVMAALILWSFAMAWQQHMGSLVYQFNYLIGSGVIMWYILFALETGDSFHRLVLLFLAGTVAGAWHEGFSLPTVAGLAVVMLVFKRCRRKNLAVAMAGLLCGAAILMLAPAGQERLGRELLHGMSLSRGMLRLIAGHPAFLLFMAMWVAGLERRGRKVVTPLMVFIIAGSVAILAVQLLTTGERRVGWWADMMSVVGVSALLEEMRRPGGPAVRRMLQAAYIAGGVAVCAHWAAVDAYTLGIRKTFAEILDRHVRRGQRVVFSDIPVFGDIPAICAGIPDVGLYISPYTLPYLDRYYHGDNKEDYLTVIPSALRHVSAEAGEEVPGGSGMRRLGGLFFMKANTPGTPERKEREMTVTMTTGLRTSAVFICSPFVSERDGCEYNFCYPWHGNWKLMAGEIEKIEL